MFDAKFPDERACEEWLIQTLWPEGITCRACKRITKFYPIRGRVSWACGACGIHISPRASTPFFRHNLPLRKLFLAFYLIDNQEPTSAPSLRRLLDVHPNIARLLRIKIQANMEHPIFVALSAYLRKEREE